MGGVVQKAFLYTVAGFCLVLVVAGCSFHRTGRGFILRGQWALECERHRIPRLSFADNRTDEPSVERISERPELLRWRIRRRGYRLASRLFVRPEKAAEANSVSPEQAGEIQLPDGAFSLPEPRRPDLVL